MDVSDPTVSMRLTVAGPRAGDILMARVVAVQVDTMDVAVAPIRRTKASGEFATNVALPGKGAYKLIVRALKKDGTPVTAKFDYQR